MVDAFWPGGGVTPAIGGDPDDFDGPTDFVGLVCAAPDIVKRGAPADDGEVRPAWLDADTAAPVRENRTPRAATMGTGVGRSFAAAVERVLTTLVDGRIRSGPGAVMLRTTIPRAIAPTMAGATRESPANFGARHVDLEGVLRTRTNASSTVSPGTTGLPPRTMAGLSTGGPFP